MVYTHWKQGFPKWQKGKYLLKSILSSFTLLLKPLLLRKDEVTIILFDPHQLTQLCAFNMLGQIYKNVKEKESFPDCLSSAGINHDTT